MIPSSQDGVPQQNAHPMRERGFAGRSGVGIVRQPYTMADGPDIQPYFNDRLKPTSSVQLNGQPHVGNYVDPCEY